MDRDQAVTPNPLTDDDEEEEFEGGDESEVEAGDGDSTVVQRVEKEADICDPESVLINPADSYIGNYVGQFLSERVIGSSRDDEEVEEEEDNVEEDGEGGGRSGKHHWRVLGTLQNSSAPPPSFLWATMRNDDFDVYLKEVLKCGHVIYDMTQDQSQERFNEVRKICRILRAQVTKFKARRVFILVSSLHSWSESTLPDPNDPDTPFNESDYRRRRTTPQYRELQLLERFVVASGCMTGGMLKAYVLGAGAVYGAEEGPLHNWFMAAWHNSNYLPIYGEGKNHMPTVHIKDLSAIIQHIMNLTPRKQRYIIAVDPVISQQEQVVKAIADGLGTTKVQRVPVENIHLNSAIPAFQADELLLNLCIETTFCQDNFNIDWLAEDGFPAVVNEVISEYRRSRNLNPFKIVILGPPGSGKTTVARQLADKYRLHHFTKDDLIESTKALMREMANQEVDQTIVRAGVEAEEKARAKLKELLQELESKEAAGPLDEDTVLMFYKFRLLTNPCQNQGFILDGYPENYYQAKALFAAEEQQYEDEEIGEEDKGKDILNPKFAPDLVFVLEAPDAFLKKRMTNLPAHDLDPKHGGQEFDAALAAYDQMTQDYDSSVQAYLDEQEIMYYPVDITTDKSDQSQGVVQQIAALMGTPRNYGISSEQEEALRKTGINQQVGMESKDKEEQALLETRELEERRKQIQKWMENLAKVKKEEFEREEAALLPLRHYLMQHVVPTLTQGLMDVTRARPEDPIDFLAEYLFQNNPGGLIGGGGDTASN